MSDTLSLEQLVHLSLGDPEAGAVNFNVLKTLLLQMLKAMNLYNYKPAMTDDDQRTLKEALSTSSTTTEKQRVSFEEPESNVGDNENDVNRKAQRRIRDRSSDRLNSLEEKVFRFESQLNALNQIPSNSELIDRAKQIQRKGSDHDVQTKATSRHGPILEIWQYTQMEKRIESAENGITRLASLLQDLLSEMNDLRESNETIKQKTDEIKKQQDELKNLVDMLNEEKTNWAKKSDVENLEEKIRNLQNLILSLRDHLNSSSQDNTPILSLPDMTGYVTWDRLEDALKGIRESIEKSSHDAAEALALTKDAKPPVQLIERQSQTSAKRKESPVVTNTVPSERLAEILEQLGTLNDRHEQLRALVKALEQNKLNREEFEAFKNQYNDLFNRLAALERSIKDLQSQGKSDLPIPPPVREIIKEVPAQSRTDYSDDLAEIRTSLHRLREELDRVKQVIQDLINAGNLNAQEIDALKKLVQQLDQIKADKTYVNNELDKKADRRDIENRVMKKDFQTACGELSQNINDCLQRFCVHDDTQKLDLEKMNREIDCKLDRLELEALRDYMEKQLKKLKRLAKEQQQTQQDHVHMVSDDEAAGLRKQLVRFHCISCDRPIDVQPQPQQPSLPINPGLRPIQSPRPYTTYELDQIRQFQKSQQLVNDLGTGTADVYATVRQCGGSHTMTLPFKRQIKSQLTVPEETLLTRNEIDIKGHDGVIYKGRIDADKLPSVDLHKKQSVVVRATFPAPKSRTETHLIPTHYPHDLSGNDRNRNDMTPPIPNLQPIQPRLKHVLRIEEEILNDSRLFSLSNTKTDFNIETIFNWNEITIEDILEIYKSTINDFYEQWMKNHICAKRSFDRQDKIQENELNEIEKQKSNENLNPVISSSENKLEINLNFIPEPTDELSDRLNDDELSSSLILNIPQPKIPSQDNDIVYNNESTILNSIITETLAKNDQLLTDKTSQTSLLKLDKATSTHFLLSMPNKQIDIFQDFYKDLFIIEKNTTTIHNLGKHERWIENASASYVHPFNTFSHQTCFYRYK